MVFRILTVYISVQRNSFGWIGIQCAMSYSQKYTPPPCFFCKFAGWVFTKIRVQQKTAKRDERKFSIFYFTRQNPLLPLRFWWLTSTQKNQCGGVYFYAHSIACAIKTHSFGVAFLAFSPGGSTRRQKKTHRSNPIHSSPRLLLFVLFHDLIWGSDILNINKIVKKNIQEEKRNSQSWKQRCMDVIWTLIRHRFNVDVVSTPIHRPSDVDVHM